MFSVKLEENENLIAVYRQTEWVLAKTVLLIFALIYIPWSLILKYELSRTFFRIMAFWSLLCLGYFIYKLLLWFINCTILTNKRIILVHYPGLFHKILEDFEISEISSVSTEKKGIINSMFDVGQIHFSLKNHTEQKIIFNQKSPEKFKSEILSLRNK